MLTIGVSHQAKEGDFHAQMDSGSGLAYVLYGLFFYWYFFMTGDSAVPEAVKGTKADPSSFMDPAAWKPLKTFQM